MIDGRYSYVFTKFYIEGEIILIKLKQNNITKKRIAAVLAEGFYEDPLYVHMLPDPKTRLQILEIFFRIYIDVFGKYGDIVATSEDLGAVAYIYYEERRGKRSVFLKDLGCAMIKAVDLLRYMKFNEVYKMIKMLKVMSSDWIYNYVDSKYIHLDLIVVKEEARGKGKAKHIIGYIIEEASMEGLPLTLETQNPDNIALYEHFGFQVIHTIEYEGMVQYCMMKKK